MGHYIACRLYGIACTLPYFLPVPLELRHLRRLHPDQGADPRQAAALRRRHRRPDRRLRGADPLPRSTAIAHSQPVAVPAGPGTAGAAAAGPLPGDRAGRPGSFTAALPAGTILNLHPIALAAWLGPASPPRSTCCRSASSTAATSSTPRPAACSGGSPSPSGSSSPCSASTGRAGSSGRDRAGDRPPPPAGLATRAPPLDRRRQALAVAGAGDLRALVHAGAARCGCLTSGLVR